MKKTILFTTLLFVLITHAYGQVNYWQQQVNYSIKVTLNDIDNTLDGYEKMEYFNHSPDTLSFIWIHLWANAYKNDRTAFSDQLLENGSTDFYFSDEDKRGYINRLDFKVNSVTAQMQDHPEHQDIIKIILPQPLPPNSAVNIETPFHVKLPFNFSRGGHVGQAYQITQWYPKPAVYDKKGWHPMPYLDQGEFYSEFGDYEVAITLPSNYVVASTGELVSEAVQEAPMTMKTSTQKILPPHPKHPPFLIKRKVVVDASIPSSLTTKTLTYKQNMVHDFAWFADKTFITKTDTLKLYNDSIVKVAAYFKPGQQGNWANSLAFMKQAVLTRSSYLGNYPYKTVTAVEAEMGFAGGMEYPTITSISPVSNEEELEGVIEHEIGHNWNYGTLATNERDHPWMDEGINTYYDDRYKTDTKITRVSPENNQGLFEKKMPANGEMFITENLYAAKKDQPIETTSAAFNEINYNAIAYFKTSQLMKMMELELGKKMLDSCMHAYYNQWKFKHPYPEDFKKVLEDVSGKKLDSAFGLLHSKGPLPSAKIKKDIQIQGFFNFNNTDKHHYIFVAPAIGANYYDKLMAGILVHNYTLPAEKFQFLLAPMYASGSKQLNGLGRLSYHWYPGSSGAKMELSLSGATFSDNAFTDSNNYKKTFRFSKVVPSLKYSFAPSNPRSTIVSFIQWKTFFIKEQNLSFKRDTLLQKDIITYPFASRYLNQLRLVLEDNRALYPYNGELLGEQGDGFLRFAFTGNYYFNYAKGGGMNVRLFAGKFLYLGDKTFMKQFNTDAYHLNMSGPKGYEDYTYSNYFTGRNEFNGFSAQQIMNRDGFFKVRTDLLSNKIGKTDNWLIAANFTTDVPKAINILQVLPFKIPFKFFVDAGTYAEAWQQGAASGRFLYDAGFQLSFFKDIVQVYIPILYSKVYRDYFKSTITEKRFLKNISFSIDIQHFKLKQLAPLAAF